MKTFVKKTTILVFLIISIFNNGYNQTIQDIASAFKGSYGNWKLSENIGEYNPDNLFDLINGAADNYLSYNFSELLVRTYELGPEDYINVEIYNHQSLPNAFGIYSSERPVSGNFKNIGIQGYQETGICNFFIDKYYVKISTHNTKNETQDVLYSIAQDVVQILGGEKKFPKELNFFPTINKLPNSESYTNINFLGYEFLHSAYLATYKIKDKQFRLFIMALKSKEEAANCLKQYTSKINLPFNSSEGRYTLTDPYNGTIKIEWQGNYIWGILNENNLKIKEDYLQLIKNNILK